MPAEISAASLQYVLVPVTHHVAGVQTDPTAFTVQVGFAAGSTTPVTDDFQDADWETNEVTNPDTYFARCLVGPAGTVELDPGTYTMWVRITAGAETPVLRAGLLRVV